MTLLTRESWRAVQPLIDQALDLPPDERTAWLEALSERSPELSAQVSDLLSEARLADEERFLEQLDERSLRGLELGSYRLERPLGEGGMGAVWLANRSDGRFEGSAAIKLLHLASVGPNGQARFQREGSALARLAHPGIAKLLDAGMSSTGQPYLVLEYIDGQPIDVFARARRLTRVEHLQLFLQVLAAVEHAHNNLVLHRDLKPSNILVTRDGTVKLLDFGIAKLLDAQVERGAAASTLEGRAFTPLYAAPEQVRGEALTTATDVYALGVLLYVLLSGRHPTSENAVTPSDCVRAVLEVEPAKLGLGDLDNILGKSLQKAPEPRYQSVAAFAEDLDRFLRQEPVRARAPSLWYRTGKLLRRRWAPLLAALLFVSALLGATLFSRAKMLEAERERDTALREGARADAQVEFQSVLLATAGDAALSMREILDTGRAVLEHDVAGRESVLVSLLLQLATSYADLNELGIAGELLGRAEALALAGHVPEALPEIRCQMADHLRWQGRYDEAASLLDGADALLAPSTPSGQRATCLLARAQLITEHGPRERSVAAGRQVVELLEQLGKTRTLQYFSALNVLAGALNETGQPRQAVESYTSALAGMDRSGRKGMLARSEMHHNLARALVNLGETERAEQIFQEAFERSQQANPDQRLAWQPAIHFAELALMQDHVDVALDIFGRIARQAVADANLFWEGRGLYGLARAQIQAGRLAEAGQAGSRVGEIVRTYPHVRDTDDVIPDEQVITGLIARANADPTASHARFLDALRDGGYHEGKRLQLLRPVVLLAAEAALALGRVDEALTLARSAKQIALVDPRAETESAHAGAALLLEGKALLAGGDATGARTVVARAVLALKHGSGASHPLTREAERLLSTLP